MSSYLLITPVHVYRNFWLSSRMQINYTDPPSQNSVIWASDTALFRELRFLLVLVIWQKSKLAKSILVEVDHLFG
jgi:hypothetical protein